MRRLLAPFAIMLLAACKPDGADEAFTDSRIPPSLEQRFWPPEGWAWGLLQPTPDMPAVRYGVAGPQGVRPHGDVLILTGYGEAAEVWFETVFQLVAEGYVVWVLEGAGQGGSARFTRPRDLGHLQTPDSDREAIAAMLAIIGAPPLLLAQSTAAPSALAALAEGGKVQRVILSAPVFDPGAPPMRVGAAAGHARTMAKVKLGWMRASGQSPWAAPNSAPKGRAGVTAAWSQANPDLRMGGVSWGWIASFQDQTAALRPERLKRIRARVLMLTAPGAHRPAQVCRALPACTLTSVPTAKGSLHLEADAVYSRWWRIVSAEAAEVFPPINGA